MRSSRLLNAIGHYHQQAIAVVLAACGLLFVAPSGLRSGFFPDDLMNIHTGWTTPSSELARDIVLPSARSYRPVGSLALKAAFLSFGLDPLPYRLLCFALLAANLVLHFAMVNLLTRSSAVAGLSSCLFSVHAFMSDLYLSTATIFDLLAFAFVHSAMLIYIRPRRRGESISWPLWIAIGVCALLAAGSKEVAIVLPVLLLAYEAVFQDGASRRLAGPSLLAVLLGAVVVLPLLAADGVMQSNPAYALKLDSSSISSTVVTYTRMLLLSNGVQPQVVYALLGSIALLALVWRSAEFRFGALMFAVAAFPLMLIDVRSLYVLYIAYSGWCLLWAVLLSRIPAPPAVTLLVVATLFGTMNLRAWPHTVSWAPPEHAKVDCALQSAPPPSGSSCEARFASPDHQRPVSAGRLHAHLCLQA